MPQLDIRQIMDIMPHRYPFLLVDRIETYEAMSIATGFKNITFNEPYFTGHFPTNPVFPGVLMIEALAQLGGCIVLAPGEFAVKTPYLAGIDKARFRRPVVPGDRFSMHVRLVRHRRNIGFVSAEANVDGEFACSAELMFSIVSDTSYFRADASVLHA